MAISGRLIAKVYLCRHTIITLLFHPQTTILFLETYPKIEQPLQIIEVCNKSPACYSKLTRKQEGAFCMESRTFYYARVSSREQNLDRQIAAFTAIGASERDIITDKESGKDLNRDGYTALKTTLLRRGDTLVVKSLDRLSRSKADIKNELQFFKDNGIRLKVLDLPTTLMEWPSGQEWVFDMVNNILIEVLGTIAQQERETIRQRQAEGIAAAKVKGKHLGRPRAKKPDNWDTIIARWRAKEITAVEAMRLTGVKRSTFYKLIV